MAEPTAHTEAPEGGHGAFPPFQSENFPSQLLWLALTFVLLYVLMSRVALPRIGSILAERSRRIADDLKAAQGLKEQSDAAMPPTRRRSPTPAPALNRSPTRRASSRPQRRRNRSKRLEAQLHERLAAAEQSIAATRSAAMGNVRTIAADTAAAIVERLIGKAPAQQEVAAALGEVIKR